MGWLEWFCVERNGEFTLGMARIGSAGEDRLGGMWPGPARNGESIFVGVRWCKPGIGVAGAVRSVKVR